MPKPTLEELAVFAKFISAFIPTTPDELPQFADGQKTTIVFLGRPGCSYCCHSVARLSIISLNRQFTVCFIDSSSKAVLRTFRKQHNIKAVPALFKTSQGKIKSARDPKLSEEEIEVFLSAQILQISY